MSTNRMDVFDLRRAVVDEYKGFATSFTRIRAEDIRQQVDALYDQGRFWPEPLVQLNPRYQAGGSVAALCDQGVLHPRCRELFNINLYRHQHEAIALAREKRSYVVTTGTGSGKSLCFFVPIVSAILAEKDRDPTPRTRAIVIYPMNALANSQRKELEKYIGGDDTHRAVTFERYTGQESQEERQRIAANPPDILLTNFMMLELLMTKQDELDRKVIGACAGLRFLVLDELHTYRGRQGADVALLVRRVRERLAGDALQCIGTSATMKSEGSQDERARVVADVASTLFAAQVTPRDIVREHVERVTDPLQTAESVSPRLGAAIDAGLPQPLTDAALWGHPLAIWVETRLGITRDAQNTAWHRAPPLTLSEAVTRLSQESGRGEEVCGLALRALLLAASAPERERAPGATGERAFFAFKLHQLISGAGNAYATLEHPPARLVTVDGQKFHPDAPTKRLYPLHFCRTCGQEVHPVVLTHRDGGRWVLDRDIDDSAAREDKHDKSDKDAAKDTTNDQAGFLLLAPTDAEYLFNDRDDDYPETWRELDPKGNTRLKRDYRGRRAQKLTVSPDGRAGGEGLAAWFFPGPYGFCTRCGETFSGPTRDRNRVSSLSAEGRSSATTTLVMSVLRWMHRREGSGIAEHTRKLLGFSDNRQDAALQAGHFNDFHFVSLFRAAVWGALRAAGPDGIRADALAAQVQRALGFDRRDPAIRAEWMAEPHQRGAHVLDAERTLRDVLSYRIWHDQTGGWRFNNPNLEALGLLRVEYMGLDALVQDDAELADAPELLRQASPETRLRVIRRVLDHMRRSRAVASLTLEPTTLEQLRARSERQLQAPWGISADERTVPSASLLLGPTGKKVVSARDEALVVRGGARSSLGQALKRPSLWGGDERVRKLKMTDVDELLEGLLRWCAEVGFVTKGLTAFDLPGWRLNEAIVVFVPGTVRPVGKKQDKHANQFFIDLTCTLADTLDQAENPLFGLEAREHTAQVDQETRKVREMRFRYSPEEQAALAQRAAEAQTKVESARFLPVMFCSPTMELGVDIAELMVVYMRNLPPTPANYAQRSGRAGRGGQAALVLTYASAQGPHDQYFFRQPKLMVHGEVRAPSLELANRELVESHLQAIWLACTMEPLHSNIAKLLNLNHPDRALVDELAAALNRPEVTHEAVRRMVTVLQSLSDALTAEAAPWFPGALAFATEIASTCARRFDASLNRWRALFRDAETQRDAARKLWDDHSAPARDRRLARVMHARAMDQLELLGQDAEHGASNDFNTYRYLATEGFLPGYNFPRLPLLAFIPRAGEKGRPSALQRPRFLGLSEFGPRSLVYHEGRAFRVTRVQLPVTARSGNSDEPLLPTGSVRLCKTCGAGHDDEELSTCLACHTPLADAERVLSTFRVENLETWPVERITANDEERRRQGFELRTSFQWSQRDGVFDAWESEVLDDAGSLATLTYGPRAKITRMNLGLRRRAADAGHGFFINPVTGYWAKSPDEDDDDGPQDPSVVVPQRVVPIVVDHKNALLVRFHGKIGEDQATLTTLQHALVRGIVTVFQLEDGELLAEPVPNRTQRGGFLLYEAAEGGAGVLSRLVAEPHAVAAVARRALEILHYSLPEDGPPPSPESSLADQPDTRCVAACYRCLLSYFNQPEHEALDRRPEPLRRLLLRLARSTVEHRRSPPPRPTPAAAPPKEDEPFSLLTWLHRRGLPAPDHGPLLVSGVSLTLVWRALYTVATPTPLPAEVQSALENLGFTVVIFGEPPTEPALTELAEALAGEGAP